MDGINAMQTGERRVGPASCRVRRSNALPLALREGCREVASLRVPAWAQGQGYATTLMHKVCREADAAGLNLMLWPQPWGDDISMSRDQLAAWYERGFGFVTIQPEPMLMARLAGAKPISGLLTRVAAACAEGCS